MGDIFDEISLEQTSKKDIFDEIELEESAPLKDIGRHIARTGSRITESLLGLPSDILQTAQLGARGLEKGASKIREKIGLSPIEPKELHLGAPGSQELKQISQKVFGKIVTPQTAKESFIDDIVSDAAVLAVPVKGKIPFLKSIGTAIVGNIGSEAAKQLGFEEKGQTAAKIGTFFLAGLSGKGNVKKYWNQQYKLAEENIPKKARLDANKLDRKLDKLSYELKKGGIETPSQKFVEKPLKQLQDIIHDGEMRVEDAVKAKQKINELRSGLFDEVKGKKGQKYARSRINEISHFLDESLENYGKTNPKFYDHYKAANEAFGGFQQSKKVGDWISRIIPFGKVGKTGFLLLESIFKPATLPYTAGGVAALKSGELLTRMFKNPTLKRYYSNLMKDAVKENKSGFIRNLKNMEKEIEEKDPDIFDKISQS